MRKGTVTGRTLGATDTPLGQALTPEATRAHINSLSPHRGPLSFPSSIRHPQPTLSQQLPPPQAWRPSLGERVPGSQWGVSWTCGLDWRRGGWP